MSIFSRIFKARGSPKNSLPGDGYRPYVGRSEEQPAGRRIQAICRQDHFRQQRDAEIVHAAHGSVLLCPGSLRGGGGTSADHIPVWEERHEGAGNGPSAVSPSP